MKQTTIEALLVQGKEALSRGDWETARLAFTDSLCVAPTAAGLEGLSWAAWWQDDAEALFDARERAYQLYRQGGDQAGAARMALWLGNDYLDFRGEEAISNGWLLLARRILKDLPTSAEHGLFALTHAEIALLLTEDTQAARKWACEAIAIGRELNHRDIEVMGLAVNGTALVTEGDLENGTAELDEAAAAAISGEVSEFMFITFILCHLIYACERARDYDRAAQWCQKAREYSDKMGFAFAQGTCRVHYAAVLVWRGKWREAEQELTDARGYLSKSRPPYEPEARVRLAELRRRQGRLEEAEALFREVDWHILASIGLGELSLEKGRLDDAEEYVQRVLRNLPPKSAAPRAAALELLVRIKAATGDHAGAQEVYFELESITQAFGTAPLVAVSTYLAGLLALANGHYEEARQRFDDAAVHFERTGGPFDAARARLDLATALKHLGRTTRALEEATAALRIFRELGATGEAAKAEEMLTKLSAPALESLSPRSILTDRQIEILRLVAQGRSDREIAAALIMSEHTVHRHVANILQRLDLSSRAAAVGQASRLGLL